MRFTKEQYQQAIRHLHDGLTQLQPDGHCCAICGDSGHQAWECGHNPLYAMAVCEGIARRATEIHDRVHDMERREGSENVAAERADILDDLHDLLHACTSDAYMGASRGPHAVHLPKKLNYRTGDGMIHEVAFFSDTQESGEFRCRDGSGHRLRFRIKAMAHARAGREIVVDETTEDVSCVLCKEASDGH